jgi:phosphate starvation-inducible membrane PsiE
MFITNKLLQLNLLVINVYIACLLRRNVWYHSNIAHCLNETEFYPYDFSAGVTVFFEK